MEHIDGVNILDFFNSAMKVNDNKFLEEKYYRAVFGQIIEAIKNLHNQGVCHRDIRNENIMITLNGVVKIVDLDRALP